MRKEMKKIIRKRVVKIRITIDLDTKNSMVLLTTVLRGIYYLRRLPDTMRNTHKGVHLIYRGLDLTHEESLKYRKIIGDDVNRVELDKSTTRITQVLFSGGSKETEVKGQIMSSWFKIIGLPSSSPHYDICPICMKKVAKSCLKWSKTERWLRITHTDQTECLVPYQTESVRGLKMLEKMGVNVE